MLDYVSEGKPRDVGADKSPFNEEMQNNIQ